MAQKKECERKVAIVGLGYVGLPIAVAFGKRGKVIGFDINAHQDWKHVHSNLLFLPLRKDQDRGSIALIVYGSLVRCTPARINRPGFVRRIQYTAESPCACYSD